MYARCGCHSTFEESINHWKTRGNGPRAAGYTHEAFNRLYGIFLFVTFNTTFATTLGCRSEVNELVVQLIDILNDENRWPELVTFEEMNWFDKGPIQILGSHFGITGSDDETPQSPSYWRWS